tara:strand:- start:647 stop:1465 length:819 start_codon:yes stop_codon:yes gene_type:complete
MVIGGNAQSSEGSPMLTFYTTRIDGRMKTTDGRLDVNTDFHTLEDNSWYHITYQTKEVGGNVSGNIYLHNASGGYLGNASNNHTTATWDVQSTRSMYWVWGNDNRSVTSNSYYMRNGASLADVRIFPSFLTKAQADELSLINPATCVSGSGGNTTNYADSDNSLGAIAWWKLGSDESSRFLIPASASSAGTGLTLVPSGNASPSTSKTGFVSLTGSTTFKPPNRIFPTRVMLQNMYVSGSDTLTTGIISDGSGNPSAYTSQVLQTKGTVVLK